MKKTILILLILFITAAVLPAGAQSFSDMPANHWAYDAVNKLVELGIIEGYPDGEYKGQRNMSRYEMAVMVSRALANIDQEMEVISSGLTNEQSQEVTAAVKALMEEHSGDNFSEAEVKEVREIVDILSYELKAELKVLGVETANLAQDVEALEAKVAELKVPEDNIEFGVEVSTIFETANYKADNNEKIAAAMRLWADDDALDLDLPVDSSEDEIIPESKETMSEYADQVADWKDADDLPAENRFWQEYDFVIKGNLGDASFDLELDSITNVFSDERSAFNYVEGDQNQLKMDTGLLTVEYNQPLFNRLRAGDIDDHYLHRYFVDEEDVELIEVTTGYFDLDWTFMIGGYEEYTKDKLYLIRTANQLESAEIYGEINQMRGSDRITNIELGFNDYSITDRFQTAAQLVFNRSKDKDTDDIFFNLKGNYALADDLNIFGVVESAGEDFTSYKGDLEEDYDFDLYTLGADYQINENNKLMAAYSLVQIGDKIRKEHEPEYDEPNFHDEDKSIIELAFNNQQGAFNNKLAVEYTINDDYTDDYESRLIELETEYLINENTKAAAAFVNKDKDNDGKNVLNYNYLKGNLDIKLADNISWENEAKYILGEVKEAEIEGESNSFTTSLVVNF